ncbi:MAG: DUF2235 domain-containing protein [Dehalococcoidia bacterium]
MTKRLIVCCDGTWNVPGARNTNVVKMWKSILPAGADGTMQKVFYDQGVGTEGGFLTRVLGGATGMGLNRNIQEAYRFLVHTYDPGDQLFLFGFSRGAYTVRSLAGLLRNSGLLRPGHEDQVQEAFELYRRDDVTPTSQRAIDFRAAHSHEVEILCLGVWDTVGSLGIPTTRFGHILNRGQQFHDVELSGSVKHGYQALAIDERRRPFRPAIWQIQKQPGEVAARTSKEGQVIEQVWFAGHHSDAGGGNPNTGLSDFAFDWMMRKARALGLAFDENYLASEVHPAPDGPTHNSMTGMWSFVTTFTRTLGRTWPATEAVHSGVLTRQQTASLAYDPKNLAQYRTSDAFRVAEETGGTEVPADLRVHG